MKPTDFAFPNPRDDRDDLYPEWGIDVRTYLAARMMQTALMGYNIPLNPDSKFNAPNADLSARAKLAVDAADALIAELNKEPK